MDAEAALFIKELKERVGGEISWRTFSTWYGSNSGILREYGVFLCKVDDKLYLEDFDRVPTFLGIPLQSKKNRVKYEQYSRFIPISDIVSIKRVSKKKAANIIRQANKGIVDEASSFARLLSPLVAQLELKDGECVYFEVIDYKEFLKVINKETN